MPIGSRLSLECSACKSADKQTRKIYLLQGEVGTSAQRKKSARGGFFIRVGACQTQAMRDGSFDARLFLSGCALLAILFWGAIEAQSTSRRIRRSFKGCGFRSIAVCE